MTLSKYSSDIKRNFTNVMETSIVPTLIDLGFKNNDLDFSRKTEDIFQAVKISLYDFNDEESVGIYFEFGFYNFEVFDIMIGLSQFGLNKSGHIRVYDCFVNSNIKMLSSHSGLYKIDSKIVEDSLKNRIENDLIEYIKPIFENYTSFNLLKEFVSNYEKRIEFHPRFPYVKAIYYLQSDQMERGKIELKASYEMLKESPFYKYEIERIANRYKIAL